MRTTLAVFVLMLTVSPIALGQGLPGQSRALGYVFVGSATNQVGLLAGVGAERYIYKTLGAASTSRRGGLGYPFYAGHGDHVILGSANVSYHLITKRFQRRASPFVSGGFTGFFGIGTGGTETHGYNIGGGLDTYRSKHIGIRLEFRYYGDGGGVLLNTFPNVQSLSLTTYRLGLTFR